MAWPTPWKSPLARLVAFLAACVLAWLAVTAYGSAQYQAGDIDGRAAMVAVLNAERAEFRARVDQLNEQREAFAQKVERETVERERAADAAAAGARGELGRLRRTIAEREDRAAADARLSGSAACAAVADGTATEGVLLGECAAAHADLAREADRLAGWIAGLQSVIAGDRELRQAAEAADR